MMFQFHHVVFLKMLCRPSGRPFAIDDNIYSNVACVALFTPEDDDADIAAFEAPAEAAACGFYDFL